MNEPAGKSPNRFMLMLVLTTVTWIAPMPAQGGSGRLEGTVRDLRGQPVWHARVHIWNTNWSAFTDRRGTYSVQGVSPGAYRVRASGPGYDADVVDSVVVHTDAVARQDFMLEPAVNRIPLFAWWEIRDRIRYPSGKHSCLSGVLLSSDSSPLAGAEVRIQRTIYSSVTDEDGRFWLPWSPLGSWAVEIAGPSSPGVVLRDVRLARDSLTRITYTMPPDSVSDREAIWTTHGYSIPASRAYEGLGPQALCDP